jgi:splicing factor 3A subunit 2
MPAQVIVKPKVRKTIKIGRPGYKVIKERDSETGQLSLTFYIDYPEADAGVKPRYRFMSAFEQKIEIPDKNYQYLLFATEPYETIAFKIPNKDIEKSAGPQVPGESKVRHQMSSSFNTLVLDEVGRIDKAIFIAITLQT